MSLHEKIFLVTAVNGWTCPPGVKRVQIEGCGGGGGGGGGYYTTNAANTWISGGSGGGGARLGLATVAVTPGVSYDITIGFGGAGGAAALTTGLVKATDGGDTIFAINGGATLVTFSGAGAGYAGGGTGISTYSRYHLGGQSTKFGSEQDEYSVLWMMSMLTANDTFLRPDMHPHQGGFSVTSNSTNGSDCSYGGPSDLVFGAAASFRGGAPGTNGTDAGTYRGGSGGGGGGAGAYGPGAAGGNGGNANGSGQGAFGTPGSDAAANTGAGGGGGGAAGFGSSNVGVAAAGGDGAQGKLIIRWTT